jgi:alkylation response protein AidB-like acyl-CoA dehydrogenase
VDIVALEMLVLRVLSAEKVGQELAGHRRPAQDPRQRDPAALCRADDAGRRPLCLPFIEEAMEAGWQGTHAGRRRRGGQRAAGGTYFNMRKTTIYGGSNEVQRNIVAQTVLRVKETEHGFRFF